MAVKVSKSTVSTLNFAMSTIVDFVDPASELAIVYYVLINLPKAIGIDKDVKRKTSNS